ncbi:MAG: TerB family tellurite resistance protein [Pseudomonadales bacterium]|nr:TerB family tellurite resistance protein [Pseudomonadales bacterium]
MIRAFRKLFEVPQQESEAEQEYRTRLAAAALLIETARADFAEDQAEDARLQSLLRRTLELDPEEVSKLVAQASSELDRSTSLFEFTRVINDHYSVEQKQELVTNMWRVAYADGRLDKYEESLIRQVAELTYVPHTDYIRAKLVARA